jgi:folliculin
VPLPCAKVCRLDILPIGHRTENTRSHVIRWAGVLPLKLPTLLIKLEKSLENDKLIDSVLKVHFSTLQEEWAKYVQYFVILFIFYIFKTITLMIYELFF